MSFKFQEQKQQIKLIIITLMSLQFLIQIPRPQGKKTRKNYISTTKYNIVTFLPLALLIQFKRYANIYFLVCAILQSIPLISPLKPFSAVAPLIFVLTLSMIREGFEDYKRWKSDEKDNSQISQCYNKNDFKQTKWKDIKQGDYIRIKKDETIPADILVLYCQSKSGISYVETASLDGEKNLKPKFSNAALQTYFNNQNDIDLNNLKGKITCINPSAEIQAFQGQVQLKCNSINISQRINKKNMILRGCKLKNVEWVIGLVVYTGQDTAIMMNGSQPFTKISNIQRKVNKFILIILAFEIFCSSFSSGYCYYGCNHLFQFEVYLFTTPNCAELAGIAFGSYFILYSTFIPISLIVSLQFVKVFQGFLMSTDEQMYCSINQRHLQCRTVSINQQLGQIDYILTDKTGTLTCNKMEFRNIVIGSQLYGQDICLEPIEEEVNYRRLSSRFSQGMKQSQSYFDSRTLNFDLQNNEQNEGPKKNKRELIELIFTIIATCHECVPTSKGGFEGPSPDEVALLNAAYKVGFKFISCENKIIKMEYKGKIKTYQLLKLIEFDSDRKRMSVTLKDNHNILVFVKGADTSIQKLLSPNQKYLADIKQRTNQMSKTGLRSLWFAYKILPLSTKIQDLSESQLQSGLKLVGATGIQDKLQDYVAQTIYSLRTGGIKFVMLTGDKLETAENIALSCRLIESGQLIRNKADLQKFAGLIQDKLTQTEYLQRSPVIDGSTLSFSQNQKNLQTVIQMSKSVVFCRVTPGQKAQIVRLVKNMGKLTLAVGDGANDVNMIMEANVGVGIFGQQGTRAAQVANYAIGQFCLLWKLLLYYGRLNYMRITQMILYFFYKNMVFTSVQFAYCFYTLGSGQSFWLSWPITLYNMVFTFFPVVIRAVFQVDIQLKPTKETFHQLSQGLHQKQILYSYYPKMYYISQKNKLFNNLKFFSWFILGTLQGVICLIFTLLAIGDQYDTSGASSYEVGFYLVEISAYTSVIIVVTLKLAINVKNWNGLLVIGFLIPSMGAYIGYTFVAQSLQDTPLYYSMSNLLSMPLFYIIQFLCIGGMFAVDFLLYSLEVSKTNFQNYLKFNTLKDRRLSKNSLNNYMLEMISTQERNIQLQVKMQL